MIIKDLASYSLAEILAGGDIIVEPEYFINSMILCHSTGLPIFHYERVRVADIMAFFLFDVLLRGCEGAHWLCCHQHVQHVLHSASTHSQFYPPVFSYPSSSSVIQNSECSQGADYSDADVASSFLLAFSYCCYSVFVADYCNRQQWSPVEVLIVVRLNRLLPHQIATKKESYTFHCTAYRHNILLQALKSFLKKDGKL